jgi:hypothetical protein
MNPRIVILASLLLSSLTVLSSLRQTQFLQQQALQRQQEQQRQEQTRREQAGLWLQQQERLRREQSNYYNYLQDVVRQSFQSRNEQQVELKQLETKILQPVTEVSDPTAMPPLVTPDVSLLAPTKPAALPPLPDHSSPIPTTAADSIVLNESATVTPKTAPGTNANQ